MRCEKNVLKIKKKTISHNQINGREFDTEMQLVDCREDFHSGQWLFH